MTTSPFTKIESLNKKLSLFEMKIEYLLL